MYYFVFLLFRNSIHRSTKREYHEIENILNFTKDHRHGVDFESHLNLQNCMCPGFILEQDITISEPRNETQMNVEQNIEEMLIDKPEVMHPVTFLRPTVSPPPHGPTF